MTRWHHDAVEKPIRSQYRKVLTNERLTSGCWNMPRVILRIQSNQDIYHQESKSDICHFLSVDIGRWSQYFPPLHPWVLTSIEKIWECCRRVQNNLTVPNSVSISIQFHQSCSWDLARLQHAASWQCSQDKIPINSRHLDSKLQLSNNIWSKKWTLQPH